jgi:hypothetical protein
MEEMLEKFPENPAAFKSPLWEIGLLERCDALLG